MTLFKDPDPPLLDSQDILQLNNSYNATVNRTNTQTKHHLADSKIQQSELLQDIRAENSKLEDNYKELRDHNVALANAIQPVDKEYDMHIANGTLTAILRGQLLREVDALKNDAALQEASIKDRETLKIQRLKELHFVKKDLETHMSLIKILPPSKTDRHWVIPMGNKHLRWLPYSSQYVPI